jgi:plastocyanin
MKRGRFSLFIIPLILILGCSSNSDNGTNPPPDSGSHHIQVDIAGFAFTPKDVTIEAGDTITWTNNDQVVHTATSTSGAAAFDSGDLSNGESYMHVFSQTGVTNYRCEKHPSIMTGTVTVQ